VNLGTDPTSPPTGAALAGLAARLREHHAEIEQAVLTRVFAISDPAEVEDPEYVAGLREAVGAGLDYGLAALQAPQAADPPPVPVQLLFQARYAARSAVPLDTVLRRYFAGYTVLGDFILIEAQREEATAPAELMRALRGEAAVFDRLLAAVSEAYRHEAERGARTAEGRRASRVRMLLAGELLDVSELDYDMDAWHLGALATGPGAKKAIRNLAKALDRRLLVVCGEQGKLWVWMGGRRRLASREALRLAESSWTGDGALAFGEPGQGIEGWRLTHRQAKAALPIAMRGERRLLNYSEVALFAAALNDDVLASSLRDAYLVPLESQRTASTLIETLRAYFAAGRNASAVATAMGVSRQTVSIRLRAAETHIGRPLDQCAAELETALALSKLVRNAVATDSIDSCHQTSHIGNGVPSERARA